MYLYAKDYVEPKKPERVVPDVKTEIKALVPPKGKKLYGDIVKTVQVEHPEMTNDDVIKQVKEVATEWEAEKPKVEEKV